MHDRHRFDPPPAPISRQLRVSMPMPSSTARPRSSLSAPDEAEMTRRLDELTRTAFPISWRSIDGAVVGYAYAGPYRARPAYRFTVENSVYVAHDIHRRGVGKALLQALIEACTETGFRLMVAVIGDSNQAASIGAARGRGLPTCRHIRKYRLQVRPLARQRADAARAGAGGEQRRPETAQFATTSASRSIDRSTRSSSWPRRTIRPVAEITL